MSLLDIVLTALYYLLSLANFLIVIRCVLSWFPMGMDNRFGNTLIMLTEPFMAPARKLLYRFQFARSLPIDFSPLLAFFFIYILQQIIIRL